MKPRVTYEIFIRASYIIGLSSIIVFLPFSKYILSMAEFWLTGAWVLQHLDREKFTRFFHRPTGPGKILYTVPFLLSLLGGSICRGFRLLFRNKAAMVLMSLYLLHLIGLLYTSDWSYAFKDLRTKAPIVLLPLFLATSEGFGKKGFYRFLLLLALVVLVVTVSNTWYLATHQYVDIREVSRHISHIILGLLICLAIFTSGYLVFGKGTVPGWVKILLSFASAWFIAYLVLTRSFTGLSIFMVTLILFLMIMAFKSKNRWLSYGLVLFLAVFMTGGALYLHSIVQQFYRVNPVDFTKLDSLTSRGNKYIFNPNSRQTENGNYVYIYIQWDELREAWNKRSKISIDSLDLKKQPLVNTLIRFLTSKGLRKDADGVNALSDQEIHAIEKGVANKVYMEQFGIRGRIFELLMGYEAYRKTGNPTGFSMMQRFEFWKASAGIIHDNWLTGVGTGDMNTAFTDQYEKMKTKLAPDNRWRSHDQYLSILVGFGVFGLAWFLFSLLYPAIRLKSLSDYFVITILTIGLLSMLTNDTIESQAGVTFFYFYYSFFLFGRKEKDRFLPGPGIT
jgi:hypothetical protein